MNETSSLQTIFEALKLYRQARLDEAANWLPNGVLYQLALHRPADRKAFQEVVPDERVYQGFGRDLIEVIRIFSPVDSEDSQNARARRKIEDFELKLYRLVVEGLKSVHHENWWFGGVPEPIRVNAARLYEESEGAIPKESALYLSDLKDLLMRQWATLGKKVAKPNESKRSFEAEFCDLLDLRNRLSHPLRLQERPIEQEEIDLLDAWLERVSDVSVEPSHE